MATPGTRAAPYAPFTTVAANADVDTWLPEDGRVVTSIPRYIENNAVFNVADYYSESGGLPTDGTTSIAAALATALSAAEAAGGGFVRLPFTPLGYNIGSASPGFLVPPYTTVECLEGVLFLTYSGTGDAISTMGSQYARVRNLYVTCTNNAANGIRIGGTVAHPSRWCRMDNFTVQNTGAAPTGSGVILDSGPQFSGFLHGQQVYSLGFKYGLDVVGIVGGSQTWTTVRLDMLTLVGRNPKITGSIGVRADANSNLQSSSLPGVVIEGFVTAYEFANATPAFGFTMTEAGIEGNTTNFPSLPAGYAGRIEDFHADYQFRQTVNGLSNLWMQERIQSGSWLSQSHYDRVHGINDGSSDTRVWGVRRGGSVVNGEYAENKFSVSTGASSDVGSTRNFIQFLTHKITWDAAAPTAGAWAAGSLVFNTSPGGGNGSREAIWQCITSGTIKAGLASLATTTNGSPTVAVDALSSLEIGDFITIAGAFASPTRIKHISGLTLTMASNASGSVSGVAVVYPAFVFRVHSWTPGMATVSADANITLVATDVPTQRVTAVLTAARTVTLPAGIQNQKFRIVRTDATAAFTLTVQTAAPTTVKVLPASTASWCDVEFDGTAWRLTAYGTL